MPPLEGESHQGRPDQSRLQYAAAPEISLPLDTLMGVKLQVRNSTRFSKLTQPVYFRM